MTDNFEIRHEREHYEVYVNGAFHCSADTIVEAGCEIDKYIEQQKEVLKLDWDRAYDHVRSVQYETYSPACNRTCEKLLDRYSIGIRTKKLYEEMMSVN